MSDAVIPNFKWYSAESRRQAPPKPSTRLLALSLLFGVGMKTKNQDSPTPRSYFVFEVFSAMLRLSVGSNYASNFGSS